MSVYFSKLPKVTYNDKITRDITRRVDFKRTTLDDNYAFLPYTIVDDDRPEDVAQYYYGGVEHTWVVYISTGMVDPYYDWPLNYEQFNAFIMKKYADMANTTGYPVIDWTKNTLITDNIVHYKNTDENEDLISVDTYTLDPNLNTSEWTAVRYYDYENEINENRRVINLIDRKYLGKLTNEIKDLMNG